MDKKPRPTIRRSGGVNVHGNLTVKGDVTGRDKNVNAGILEFEINRTFGYVEQAVNQNEDAMQKLESLKAEVAKRDHASDGVIAKLVKGIVGLVPNAVSAIVSAFSAPLLAGIAGPVTKRLLEKISGR